MFVAIEDIIDQLRIAQLDVMRRDLSGARAKRRRQRLLGWLIAAALVCGRAGAASAASPLQAEPELPLAAAVRQAVAAEGVWPGGTTPRAASLTAGNALGELLVGTPAVNAALAASIAAAQDEVLLQVYEWSDDDEATAALRRAIAARLEAARRDPAKRPFRLAITLGAAWLAENGLRHDELISAFSPGASAGAEHVRCELLLYEGSLLDILHSKTLVVDGQQALLMTGNLNTHGGLEQDSFNVAAPVRGPVVKALQQDFHHARVRARSVLARHLAVPYLAHDDASWATEAAPTPGLRASAGAPMRWLQGGLQATVLTRPADWSYFYRGDKNPQARGLLALFEQARYHIVAINPALNVQAYKTAIVNAIVRRGVQVDLLLSYHMNKTRQHYLMGGDNADMAAEVYGMLLAKGGRAAADRLRIYWGTTSAGDIAPPHDPGNVHAKIASFDGDVLLVGSTNWDWPSYNSARELSVALFGADVGTRFEQEVFAPRRSSSRRIAGDDLPKHARRTGHLVYDYLQSLP